MYLHLGNETVVSFDDIIGIFDLDTVTVSKITRDFLKEAQKNGDIVNVSYELPKSFIICRDNKRKSKQTVYISQISSATLLKRTSFVNNLRKTLT